MKKWPEDIQSGLGSFVTSTADRAGYSLPSNTVPYNIPSIVTLLAE
ncbi:MAG: hypothetical protein ACREVX_14600 [Clostridium sp.]